jgi:hypothetical protein
MSPARVGAVRAWTLLVALALGGCSDVVEEGRACATTTQELFGGGTDAGATATTSHVQNAVAGLETSGGSLVCTGTFVSPTVLLTAAHCSVGEPLRVRATDGGPAILTSLVGVHPELDVMSVQLEPGWKVTDRMPAPLPLWSSGVGTDWIGKRALLGGFGRDEQGISGLLLFAEETISAVTSSELQVDGEGQSGACGGDSGGPLLAIDEAGSVRLLGVLERGSRDCRGTDVYARADILAPWLEGQIDTTCD